MTIKFKLIEEPRSKLQGIFDRKEVSHFWIRSLTPQPRWGGISALLRHAAANALAIAVQIRVLASLFSAVFLLCFCVSEGLCGQDYVPGEIIIKLKIEHERIADFKGKEFKLLFSIPKKKHFVRSSVYSQLSRTYLMRVKKGTELQACENYRKMPGVAYAEPNYLQHLCVIPNDPGYGQQWNLSNIYSESAWDTETGSSDVVVAVIDTGVDYLHEDLDANIWHNPGEIPDNAIDDDGNGYVDDVIGWDFVDASGGAAGEDFVDHDNDPMDRHGHGTHVAGIAGAASNNGIGIAGVAWNCKIMPVRAGFKTPSGDGVLESDDAAQAIVYAAENGAKALNLSWGDYQKSSLIEDAIRFAADQGALICAAAGNENSSSLLYPAALENSSVVAVGATDSQDKMAYFSNYGDWVHMSAPGASIYSTYLSNSYTSMSGTSMATPHVTGLAGLLFSYFPELTPPEIKARIMRSVDILQELNDKNITSGRINAYTSLVAQYSTPHIFSLSPDPVHEGDQVTLFGDRFGPEQGSGSVTFYSGIDAEIITWSECEIICRVPEEAQSGKVTVTTSEGMSNEVEITILESFYDETLIENEFLGAGTAQGWQADDQSWLFQLPFSFPFFGQEYDSVYVCSNGFLDFTDSSPSYLNSQSVLKTRVLIAPLWDDLITNGASQQEEDIYVHSPSGDSVCFRWAGESYETGGPVNVEVTLYRDGWIQFNYGPGNTGLSPTIGISSGSGENYNLAVYDGQSDLAEVESALFTPREQSFTIALDSGWNLISLPLKPENNQVGQIMGDVNGGIESVWGYEDGVWYVYDPLNPGFSDLEVMKTGYGFWVKATQQGLNIQIQGQMIPLSLSLTNGWNLIGFNSLQSMSVEDALAGIGGEIESVWGYKDGAWYVYDPANPDFSDFEEMDTLRGYWIKIK